MVLIKVRYDAYNRQFKLMDRELAHMLEDGEDVCRHGRRLSRRPKTDQGVGDIVRGLRHRLSGGDACRVGVFPTDSVVTQFESSRLCVFAIPVQTC